MALGAEAETVEADNVGAATLAADVLARDCEHEVAADGRRCRNPIVERELEVDADDVLLDATDDEHVAADGLNEIDGNLRPAAERREAVAARLARAEHRSPAVVPENAGPQVEHRVRTVRAIDSSNRTELTRSLRHASGSEEAEEPRRIDRDHSTTVVVTDDANGNCASGTSPAKRL